MPISQDFQNRLYPLLEQIVDHFGSPFHIYDEKGLREGGENLTRTFSAIRGFKEYFAVKALPNPRIQIDSNPVSFSHGCWPVLVTTQR